MSADRPVSGRYPVDAEHRAIGFYSSAPYRPADFDDWRDGIMTRLTASAGVLGSFHIPENS